MALNPYDFCPCGSGKKFKWCCQPIHHQISKAFQQDEEGQHEVALQTMNQVVAEHPGNPEVWGRKAQLLYQMDQVEEAEKALDKAFEINPQYPFGSLLKGRFRHYEGEILGALMLFRKAAELYHPDAGSVLGQVQGLIADCELKLNHPLAARAALELAARLAPQEETLRTGLEQTFGKESRYPPVARQAPAFKALPPGATAEKRKAWDQALGQAATGRLHDAVRAFQQLAGADEKDAAAWYNLGLSLAWLGENSRAVEALDRYVTLEGDESKAADAWSLAEVLRQGQGMEDQADTVEYSITAPLRDPQSFAKILGDLERQGRLVGATVNEQEHTLNALILEKLPALTPELAARQAPRLGANLIMMGNILRLWNTNKEALDKVFDEIRQQASNALGEVFQARGPASFGEVASEALAFPAGLTSEAEARQKMAGPVEKFFEETWLHRSLKSLGGVTPLDAGGHPVLRKKLRGLVQFLNECGDLIQLPYDFDRLRRKLGLLETGPTSVGAPTPDISAMSAAELASLGVDTLGDDQLEQAYQTAAKLDAGELASRFAQALVGRPPRPEKSDRYPWYGQLIKQALAGGDPVAALNWIDEGEKADCEQNEGRRRNDYELRRGQVLAKKGDLDQAQDVFERLTARVPNEVRFLASAAETLLSARQGARAKPFAEKGLDEARKQNNRDSEEHFKELLAAAQKG